MDNTNNNRTNIIYKNFLPTYLFTFCPVLLPPVNGFIYDTEGVSKQKVHGSILL